jgi:hypothetical protein
MGANMMKKHVLIMGIFVLLIVFLHSVSANLVCGQVIDSEDNVSAQWYNVRLTHPYEDDETFCQVSPAENKFCGDAETIDGTWNIGEEIIAEIYDNESGYAAGPVSLTTTGEGYDVFPVMQLEKVIKANYEKLLFSNNSKFLINASFKSPYNQIETTGIKNTSCTDCTNLTQNIQAHFGMNHLTIKAKNQDKVFTEEIDFAILNNFYFNRKTECEGCNNKLVRENKEVEVLIEVNLSHEVDDFELKEYVPKEWKITDCDGKIRDYSDSHNVIVWKVSGKEIIKNYKFKSPEVFFFPKKYFLKSELENKKINEEELIVYRLFSFWSFKSDSDFKSLEKKIYSRVQPGKALVVKPKNKSLTLAGIYPNNTIKNVWFEIKELQADIDGGIECYSFDTNIHKKDIEKIFLEFKVDKKLAEKYEKLNVHFFDEDFSEWNEKEIKIQREDEDYYHYTAEINPHYKIALAGKEKKWFSNLLSFFN